MITVKVIYQSSGKAAEGKKVALGFSSIFRGVTSGEYTDRNLTSLFGDAPRRKINSN